MDSPHLASFLRRTHYAEVGRTAPREALTQAIGTLTAEAEWGGAQRNVSTRVARHNDRIYLDLANASGEVVEISDQGWAITRTPPVRFLRKRGMELLPAPVKGGSIDELRKFVNVADANFPLVVGFVLASLRPTGPYPILLICGGQGTAKSTTTRVLRRLIDPSRADIRALPTTELDLVIAAQNSHMQCFDNISRLKEWHEDALCRLATGGGHRVRQLYSNDEETIFDAARPCILNGIGDMSHRSDLLDRSHLLETMPIDKRLPEADFWREFEITRPRLLGCFLDGVSGALRGSLHASTSNLPRMADVVLWVTAAEESAGIERGSYKKAYEENRRLIHLSIVESNAVAQGVYHLLASKDCWEGTASQLLTEIGRIVFLKRRRDLPRAPNGLSVELFRIAPNLEALGIRVTRPPRSASSRAIRIERLDTNDMVSRGAPLPD